MMTDVRTASSVMISTVMPVKILVPFNTSGLLYGMERAVIELFDSLRPRVTPHFLISHTMLRQKLPVLAEVQRRGLSHSFFSDTEEWPSFRRPHSFRLAWELTVALLKGNRDVFRQAMQCDALYLCGVRYSFYSFLACIYCVLAGKRVIFQFHDLITYRSRILPILRFFVRDFIHDTEIGFRMVSKSNPCVLKRNNHVIPYVVQTPDTNGTDDLPETLARGKRTILFVGQVSAHKGVDLLLEAVALLDGYPDMLLLIIGACSPEFQPAFDALLADERIAKRVVHLGYRKDVFRFLAGAYVYVHPTPPSRFLEAFGRSALEAMACGIPTICFRAGAIEEVVVHGETGLICDVEDPGCLAGSLRQFLDNRQFRDVCGAQAKKRFETVYSAQRLEAAWKKLLTI